MQPDNARASRMAPAYMSAGERRLLAKIMNGVAYDSRRYISDAEAISAFRLGFAEFKPGYDLINMASLPFAIPIILSWFVFEFSMTVRVLLLIPLLILAVFSMRRLLAFKQRMRIELETIAGRNLHNESNASAPRKAAAAEVP